MNLCLLTLLVFVFSSLTIAQDGAMNSNSPSAVTDPSVDYILGERDPFSPPKYIREMEFERTKERTTVKVVRPEDIIDNQMEAIRRWPLTDYSLVAVIWDVKNPKAMITDKANTMHLLKKNYRIGNREGIITEINESEVVVMQNGVPFVIQIHRSQGGVRSSENQKTNQNPVNNSNPNSGAK